MHFKTTVGQVAVVNGRRYDRVDGRLVDERSARLAKGRGRGNLYILVETAGTDQRFHAVAREGIGDRLAQVVCDTYYSQRGSVTAGLQMAVQVANSLLFEYNCESMPDEQRIAGLSCAVLRGEDLFIAQAGPAALFLAQERRVTRFPEVSPWLDKVPLDEADAAPVGTRQNVLVDLFHMRVRAGDSALLVDSGTALRVAPQRWPSILGISSVEQVLGELVDAGEGDDVSGLAVILGPQEAVPAAAPASAPAVAQVRQGGQADTPSRTAGEPHRSKVGETGHRLSRAAASLWAASLTFLDSMMPSQHRTRQTPRRKTTTVKRVEKTRQETSKDETKSRDRSALIQKLLIGIAIIIPLIVAVVVLLSVVQRGQTKRSELEGLWLSANALWVQAEAVSDPATVRARLGEAQGFLDQLLARQPDHVDALALQQRIQARLEENDQVRRVRWEGQLTTYPQDAHLSRVVVEGIHVFVMDRNADNIYHHRLDEFQQSLLPDTSDAIILRKGDQIGNALVGDLLDMAWMPVGNGRQKAGLVILTSDGALFEYEPATESLTPLQVAATEAWQLPELVGSHSGRFYVLDSLANQIWRYAPTPDGYTSRPNEWLQSPTDLAGVRDMAIGDNIFLLYADGMIQKLKAGEAAPFDISDWDMPPQGPTAIFTRPPNETQWLYVADPGNNRIVQASKEGGFRRQFRLAGSQGGDSGALADVTSLFVDEIGGRAYVLSGQSLYMIILPD